jgi:hypothetical protein
MYAGIVYNEKLKMKSEKGDSQKMTAVYGKEAREGRHLQPLYFRTAVAGCSRNNGLEGVHSFFSGADPDGLFDGKYENLSIPDFSGIGGISDFIDHLIRHRGGYDHFDFDLRDKIDHIFRSPINFLMPFLPTVPLDFGDGHSLNSKLVQRLFDIIELERLDDGLYFFHRILQKMQLSVLTAS